YVQANLLEPLADEASAVAQRLDFNTEYQTFLTRLQEAEEPLVEVEDVAPLGAIEDHLQAEPLSEELQIRDEAWTQYLQARDRFYEAQTELEMRGERRREEFSQLLIPADSDEEARHTIREDLIFDVYIVTGKSHAPLSTPRAWSWKRGGAQGSWTSI
ncbi:hypothetical protein LTR95_015568, partial [Oleoguttula sp. CCFEE 5521]